jgi:hypothetical protein
MTPLNRRLIALEPAPALSRVVYRAFATEIEAAADGEPALGVTVVRVVTGVSRSFEPGAPDGI